MHDSVRPVPYPSTHGNEGPCIEWKHETPCNRASDWPVGPDGGAARSAAYRQRFARLIGSFLYRHIEYHIKHRQTHHCETTYERRGRRRTCVPPAPVRFLSEDLPSPLLSKRSAKRPQDTLDKRFRDD